MKIKKLLFLLLIGASLFSASCEKEEDDDDKDDGEDIIVPESLLLKSYIDGQDLFTFNYTDHKMTSFDIGNPSGTDTYMTINFEYSGDKLMKWEASQGGEVLGNMIFSDHGSNNLPAKADYSSINGGTSELMAKYTYNYSGDKIIEVTMSDEMSGGIMVSKVTYTYANDNIETEKLYDFVSGTAELAYTYEYTYDDKINPMQNIGIFNFFNYAIFRGLSLTDVNNYNKRTVYESDGTLNNVESHNRSFDYNSNDNPTKCMIVSFNGNDEGVITYNY